MPLRSYTSFDRGNLYSVSAETSFTTRPILKFGMSLDAKTYENRRAGLSLNLDKNRRFTPAEASQETLTESLNSTKSRKVSIDEDKKVRPRLQYGYGFDEGSDYRESNEIEFLSEVDIPFDKKQKRKLSKPFSSVEEKREVSDLDAIATCSKYLSKSEEICLNDNVKSFDSDKQSDDKRSSSNETTSSKPNVSFGVTEKDTSNNSSFESDNSSTNTSKYASIIDRSNLPFNSSAIDENSAVLDVSKRPSSTSTSITNMSQDSTLHFSYQRRPMFFPRKLIKQSRVQRLSSTSLQVQNTPSSNTTPSVNGKETRLSKLFDKKFMIKRQQTRLEKSQRFSTSALYDDESNKIVERNRRLFNRLSSVELFEKFCSSDFSSLYDDVDEEDGYDLYMDYYNYYRHPISGRSDDTSRNFFNFQEPTLEEQFECNNLSFNEGSPVSPENPSTSTILDFQQFSASTLAQKRQSFGAVRKILRQQELESSDDVFENTDSPLKQKLKLTRQQSSIADTQQLNLRLSFNESDFTETSLNDDFTISNFNEDLFISSLNEDMPLSPSSLSDDLSEYFNRTLICDESMNRYIVNDSYEPCRHLTSSFKRHSFKKELIPSFKDLHYLDIQHIDDDVSPNSFKRKKDDRFLYEEACEKLELSQLDKKQLIATIDEANYIIEASSNVCSPNDVNKEGSGTVSTNGKEIKDLAIYTSNQDELIIEYKNVESVNETEKDKFNSKFTEFNTNSKSNVEHKESTDSLANLYVDTKAVQYTDSLAPSKTDVFIPVDCKNRNSSSPINVLHKKTKCYPL